MFKIPILKSRKTDGGLVEQTYFNHKDGELKRHFKAVRMGVSWPAADVPGAFVTVGRQFAKVDPEEDTLELLAECEFNELSLEKFFSEIVEYYLLYGVGEIYLDMDESACFLPWQDFASIPGSRSISYIDAPYKKNPFAGISNVKDSLRRNKLILPQGSKVREQASKLELQDLTDDLSKRFPLVEALRYVVSGFSKDPPRAPIRVPGMRGVRTNYADRSTSWMSM